LIPQTNDNLYKDIVLSGNKQIPITAEKDGIIAKAKKSEPFNNWLKNFDHSQFELRSINIQCLDVFQTASKEEKICFIKFDASVFKDGKKVPGVVFLRGGAVCILTILECNGVEYTIVTVQPRIPLGRLFTEIPAGMLDNNKNFIGVAAKELQEETGIKITEDKLIDLTKSTYGDRYSGIIPSAGGCDEFVCCYLYKEQVTEQKLKEFQGKLTGDIEEGEAITLKVIELKNLYKETSDVKALCCLYFYDIYKNQNRDTTLTAAELRNELVRVKSEKYDNETVLKKELDKTVKLLDNEKRSKSLYQISVSIILSLLTSILILRWAGLHAINMGIFPPS